MCGCGGAERQFAKWRAAMWRSLILVALGATATSAQQVVPPNTFGIVQSMSFTTGTGDANDILIVCGAEVAAAQATTETATQTIDPAPTANDAYSYFQAVAWANLPYYLDGSESQEFINIYDCAANDVPHWNAWDPNAPPSGADAAAGEHACAARIGMDYGGNPSCECRQALFHQRREHVFLAITHHFLTHARNAQMVVQRGAQQTQRELSAL